MRGLFILAFFLLPSSFVLAATAVNQPEERTIDFKSKALTVEYRYMDIDESGYVSNTTSDSFLILKDLELKNSTTQLYTNILYDAFSNNTNEELWDQSFLEEFIESYCDREFCYFSTYAATSNLKRALKEKGFTLEKRQGFSRKRESTFAYRL